MTISVCMIVKNEQEVLPRCLNSIAGLWDELIIVDTGSTDRTTEIAYEFGAKVIHYQWEQPGNKGAARNFGIDQATGDWIFIIDADEVVTNPVKARTAILDAQTDLLTVLFDNWLNGEITVSWRQVRVYRRGACIYKYREHEVPIPIKEGWTMADSPIHFEHRAPAERQTGKHSPMLARLELDVEENPIDPHPLYFLHREHLNQGQYQRSIELGNRYLNLVKDGAFIKAEVYANLATAYENLGDHHNAAVNMHIACACEPNNQDWLYRLATLYHWQQQYTVSIAMCRAALELPPYQERQWEPQTMQRLYALLADNQARIAHTLAHSHSH